MTAMRWAGVVVWALVAGYAAMLVVRFPADNLMLDVAVSRPPKTWGLVYFLGNFLFMIAAVGVGPLAAPHNVRRDTAGKLAIGSLAIIAVSTLWLVAVGFPLGRLFAFIAGLASAGGVALAWQMWSRRP